MKINRTSLTAISTLSLFSRLHTYGQTFSQTGLPHVS